MLQLLSKPEFRTNIRTYNAAFSFCSFQATTDPNLSAGSIYTMKIMRQIYHRIGPLIPSKGEPIKAAQIYIHDGQEAQDQLRQDYSQKLNKTNIQLINFILQDECDNPYVKQFKYAASVLKKNPRPNYKLLSKQIKKTIKVTRNVITYF